MVGGPQVHASTMYNAVSFALAITNLARRPMKPDRSCIAAQLAC